MVSEQVELTNPVETSVGGMRGHILRRSIHLSMALLPWIYFSHGDEIAHLLSLTLDQVVAAVIITILVAETVRLKFGVTIFGQRDYEAKQVSALAWGAFAIGFVFLLAPQKAYAYPLILSLSLGDPLMGELRRMGMTSKQVMSIATLFLLAIWIGSTLKFGTPIWMSILLAPTCMIAEWPRLRYIDDNATMILIPLALILVLDPFAGILG